jgi:long-chain fatty acid transport protein
MRSIMLPGLTAGTTLAALAVPGAVHAGALEQVVPATIRLLYEEGRYLEFGATYVEPKQSGEGGVVPPNPVIPAGPISGDTGQIFNSQWSFSGAYKADLNDRVSYLLAFDQPIAGDTSYGTGTYPFPVYKGTGAEVDTFQVTAALAYDVTPNVKIYGGLRAQRYDAKSTVSFSNYDVDAEAKWGYGYLLGVAYEKPEIAFRVALTYYSAIDYDLSTTESAQIPGAPDRITQNTTTDVETPQSVQLDFQTGIAPRTLAFGYVRWVDWPEFTTTPPLFGQITAAVTGEPLPLVKYESAIWTYNLGIGRQLTDRLAGAFAITYEPKTGDTMPTLAPYDGQITGTLSLSYDIEDFTVSGGVSYGVLGDAKNDFGSDFNDGSVWGAGLRIAYNF